MRSIPHFGSVGLLLFTLDRRLAPDGRAFVATRIGNRRLVWLQYVKRRWTDGRTSGLGPRWIYRKTTDERDQVLNLR